MTEQRCGNCMCTGILASTAQYRAAVHRLDEELQPLKAEKAVLEEQLAALCELHTADGQGSATVDAAAATTAIVCSAVSKQRTAALPAAALPAEAQQAVAHSSDNGRDNGRHVSSHVSVHSSDGDSMSVDGSVHYKDDAAAARSVVARAGGLMSRGTALLPAATAALIEGHLLVHRTQQSEPLRHSSSSQLQVRCCIPTAFFAQLNT
jgi:hypothetical protein